MATYAIGDIHGCMTALETVVNAAGIGADETLVLLGDYIDRGPNSRGVIEWARTYTDSTLVALRGNHEVMMLEARDDPQKYFSWLHFGGEETLESYALKDGQQWTECIPQEHWDWLELTLPYYATETHIYVHAGVKAGRDLEEQEDATLYWRKQNNPKRYLKDMTVICGHTTQYAGDIGNFEHTVLLDTYAYGGEWLTCLNADSGEFWQANEQGDVRTGTLDSLLES